MIVRSICRRAALRSPIFIASLCLAVCACAPVYRPMYNPAMDLQAHLTPDQLKAAEDRTLARVKISTVDFKNFGDSKRSRVARSLIRQTWGESCRPTVVRQMGYIPIGTSVTSRWFVGCEGETLMPAYQLEFPEVESHGTKVLKCYSSGPRQTICSIVGHPLT